MAVATAVLTVVDFWTDTKREHVIGTLAIQASPATYATGGLALAFTDSKIKSTKIRRVVIDGLSAEFRYVYVASTGKVKIFDEDQTSGVQAELAASSVPAGVSGDTINVYAIFDQLR